MIKLIEISKLHPHPQNPRQDLGDISELAESIKSQGILQNLTAVPDHNYYDSDKKEFERYTVIIGHRRLAAAKLAGLTEVPCAIAEMDIKTQIATMLLENMQRSDLTILEQADGFQMMMDLGETVGDISDKTGFSETTIRRRVKLLELDKDKFKKSVERGATLMDYADLDKIQDINLRNSVLDKIGTPNFKWELQQAITKEANEKVMALIVAELEKFATQIKDSNSGLQYVKGYYASQNPTVTIPDDADTAEYVFVVSNYGYATLYKKYTKSEAPIVQDEKQKKLRERSAALDEISKRAYRLRYDFIREISNATAKKNIGVVIEYSLRAMLDGYIDMELDEYIDFLGIEVTEDNENDDDIDFSIVQEAVTAQPERHLLIAAYLMLESDRDHYYDWNNQYKDNEGLNTVYDFLEKLGYEMSDEERAMRDGTHKLFEETCEKGS
jgi:ParB family chromosome partitioning protein